MKNSIIVFLFFCAGCLLGFSGEIKLDAHHISLYILYALMLQVGIRLASLLLSRWSVFECMAVGSGFAYYSLSSILITQFKEPSIGLQLATELGTIALLSNIIREMMALLGSPLIEKYFGKLAPISAAGVNSMDVVLPAITRYSGKEMIPVAILHGILIDFSVPLFVSFFCSL